jgi:hypothetical protein
MIQRLGTTLSRFASRWVPDPFVLAILLTFVTFGLAAAVMGTDVTTAVDFWGGELGDGKVGDGARLGQCETHEACHPRTRRQTADCHSSDCFDGHVCHDMWPP